MNLSDRSSTRLKPACAGKQSNCRQSAAASINSLLNSKLKSLGGVERPFKTSLSKPSTSIFMNCGAPNFLIKASSVETGTTALRFHFIPEKRFDLLATAIHSSDRDPR